MASSLVFGDERISGSIREPTSARPARADVEKRRRGFGMKHGSRMGIERYRGRLCPSGFRSLDDGLHYFLMSEMQTIENAQRQDRRAKYVGVLGAVKYFHRRISLAY